MNSSIQILSRNISTAFVCSVGATRLAAADCFFRRAETIARGKQKEAFKPTTHVDMKRKTTLTDTATDGRGINGERAEDVQTAWRYNSFGSTITSSVSIHGQMIF